MIRLFEQNDIRVINEIYNQAIVAGFNAFENILSYKDRLNWFKNRNNNTYPVYVYEINKKVIGWIYFSPYRLNRSSLANTVEVSYYVHQSHYRKGVGSKLLKYAISIAPSLRFNTLIAILISSNLASIRLLEKFGFEQWGKLPNVILKNNASPQHHLYFGKHL